MKYRKILLFIFCVFLLCGCDSNINNLNQPIANIKQTHIYRKDIDCIVKDCNYNYWYASGTHFKANIIVYSEKYNLTKEFNLDGLDAKKCENLTKGDIVTCELCTWKNDSGKTIKREIIDIK